MENGQIIVFTNKNITIISLIGFSITSVIIDKYKTLFKKKIMF